MSVALSQSSSPQKSTAAVGIPRFNALDLHVASESGLLLLKDGGGIIQFRDGATEITVYGFGQDTLPKVGSRMKVWGISLEEGPFMLTTAECTAHGAGLLKNSATFIQQVVQKEANVGVPLFNASEVNVASEFGLLLLKDVGGVITFREGATEITLYGFSEDTLPAIGTSVKVWGISHQEGPFFLPAAKCISHGSGLSRNSATFIQVVAPEIDGLGMPQPNALNVTVTSDGQTLVKDGSGVIQFRFGGTELTLYGLEQGKLPAIGAIVSIWGVSLERGHFFLPNARCTAHGEGVLKNSATFIQMVVAP